MTLPLQSNLLGLPLAPAQCVVDAEKERLVTQAIISSAQNNLWHDAGLLERYLEDFTQWIISSKNNKITGLDQLPVAVFSAGTSEAFDKFYLKHCGRRFRCFRGEYLYHRLVWQNQNLSWCYLDDEELQSNDAVIISLPFADTGSQHPMHTRKLLDSCLALGVPVLLDCAFFGICGGIDFDFSHPAVTEVTFSLSKVVPANTLRIGIRFSRTNDGDGLMIYNSTQYINCLGMAVAVRLMPSHHPDETFDRYRAQQIEWCRLHDLEVSDTVIFGLDTKHAFDHYNRGYPHSNRLCFAKYFNQGPLPL